MIGKDIKLETDHKPLVPLLGKTNLDCLPHRVLHFWIHLMRMSSCCRQTLVYRGCTLQSTCSYSWQHAGWGRQPYWAVADIVSLLPANAGCLHKYHTAQHNDPTYSELIALCKSGWPRKDQPLQPSCSIGRCEETEGNTTNAGRVFALVAGMKNTSCWRSGGPGTSIHRRKLERDAATTCNLQMGTYMHRICAHVQVVLTCAGGLFLGPLAHIVTCTVWWWFYSK